MSKTYKPIPYLPDYSVSENGWVISTQEGGNPIIATMYRGFHLINIEGDDYMQSKLVKDTWGSPASTNKRLLRQPR